MKKSVRNFGISAYHALSRGNIVPVIEDLALLGAPSSFEIGPARYYPDQFAQSKALRTRFSKTTGSPPT